MYLDFNISAKELEIQISKLKPQKGICIFIDICDSAKAKQKYPKYWLAKIGSTLLRCSDHDKMFEESVIKYIGDEVMLFIPEQRIKKYNEFFIRIFNVIAYCMDIQGEEHLYYPIKASIHYCKEVYEASYKKIMPVDYYGIEIDLAARLVSKAKMNQIIISKEFYEKVIEEIPGAFRDLVCNFCADTDLKGIDGVDGYYVIQISDKKMRS